MTILSGADQPSPGDQHANDSYDSDAPAALQSRLTAHEMALRAATARMVNGSLRATTPTTATTTLDSRHFDRRMDSRFSSGASWSSFYKSQNRLPLSAQRKTASRRTVILITVVALLLVAFAVCIPVFWLKGGSKSETSILLWTRSIAVQFSLR